MKISDFKRFVEFGKKIVACGRNYKYVSLTFAIIRQCEVFLTFDYFTARIY